MRSKYQTQKSLVTAGLLGVVCALAVLVVNVITGCVSWLSLTVVIFPIALVAWTWNRRKKAELALQAIHAHVDSNLKKFLFDDGQNNPEEALKKLDLHLQESAQFIRNIGEGNFDITYQGMTSDLEKINIGSLSGELLQMKNKMMAVAEADKQRTWVANGIACFSEIVRSQITKKENVFNVFIAELVRYMEANQGGIFIAEKNSTQDVMLDLKGCYAYGRRKFIEKTVAVGEGLVGQAYQEGDVIYLTDVPSNYVSITSGLGEATPRCVIIVPMKNHEEIEGIIEIASFKVWKKFEVDFLLRVAEILGSAVTNIKIADRTNALLQESRLQAEQLKSQEEELRQNLEEINATQEAVERKSRESLAQNNKLNAIMDSTADAIITTDDTGTIESANRSGVLLFGYRENEMVGLHAEVLFNLSASGDHGVSDFNQMVNKQKSQSLRLDASKKNGIIFPAEVSISQADLGDRRIYTVIVRDITDQVKADHDQQQYIEELRAQEEELKQNMEEMQATQEEIHRQMERTNLLNRELDARIAALNISTIMSESDLYGNILFINDKFCEVSQYTREELIGKPHKIVRHPDMPKEVFKLMWTTIKAGKVFRGIIKNKKKDGSHYWVDAIISPVLDDAGNPVKYVGVRYVIEDEEQAQKLFLAQIIELQVSHSNQNFPVVEQTRAA